MADLTPDIAAVVHAACETNAQEIAGALSRSLDQTLEVSVRPAGTLDLEQLPPGSDGPGLLMLFKFGEIGAIGFLPDASGLVPQWAAAPDATGQSKLTTLAQELSMLLVPEAFMADDFKAAKVQHLAGVLQRVGVQRGAGLVPLTITCGEQSGTFSFIWPCPQPATAYDEEPLEAEAKPEPSRMPAPAASRGPAVSDLSDLPPYTRSLLRIKVPVMVKLASKKQSIHQIVELGAGSIIKFDKSCEEMLELEVAGLPIAQGEAVKVGDKFGLRINSMILPGERFQKLDPRRRAQ